MKIKNQDYNNVTVIELNGEFTEDTTVMFHDNLSELIGQGKRNIVLDMSHTPFIDSKGLEQMLWLRDYCHDNRCQLKVACLDENCHTILKITQIENEFDRYVELAEAVKSFT